jgi:uncharacterized protein
MCSGRGSEKGSQTAMKAVLAFLSGALLCVAQKPNHCYDSPEHLHQCLEAGDAEAEFVMGFRYQFGEDGDEQNYETAMKWYRLSAEHGYPDAQLSIGFLYHEAKGVPQDYAEALRWYRLAAIHLPAAQTRVGLALYLGEGVAKNLTEAAAWFGKAAEHGDSQAQLVLGGLYEIGYGVPQDYVLAHMWYDLASAQGDAQAGKWLDELAAKMTAAQIAEAQRLAREFKPKAPVDPLGEHVSGKVVSR